MVIIQFKYVEPGQEFVLARYDVGFIGDVLIEVCVATNDGRGVSCHNGSLIDMDSEEYVIVEEEVKLSERN